MLLETLGVDMSSGIAAVAGNGVMDEYELLSMYVYQAPYRLEQILPVPASMSSIRAPQPPLLVAPQRRAPLDDRIRQRGVAGRRLGGNRGEQVRRQPPTARPPLLHREGRRPLKPLPQLHHLPREQAAESRVQLGTGREVAARAGRRPQRAIVAPARVIQREVHEGGERQRSGAADRAAQRRHEPRPAETVRGGGT